MAITVGGTNITMNDSTVQATAYVGRRAQIVTSSGAFTIPAGVTALKVTVVGGGGGGGGTQINAPCLEYGGGGGAGGSGISWLTGLTPGNTINVTIGAGGTQGVWANGGTGGASSISSGTQTVTTITANGGAGGIRTSGQGGQGGTCTGAQLNRRGAFAFGNTTGTAQVTGGGSANGAPSPLGGGGVIAPYTQNTNGTNADLYGGGGSGSFTGVSGASRTGGTGAAGVVIFEW